MASFYNILAASCMCIVMCFSFASSAAGVEIMSGETDRIPVGEDSVYDTTLAPAPTPSPSPTTTPEPCLFDLNDLSRIVIAINDGLDFFQDHIADLVLDAATGTRILEAQLQLVLREPSFNISRNMRRALNLLYTKSRVLSEQIVVNVHHDPDLPESVKNNTLPWVKSYHLWQSPKIGRWSDNGNFTTSSAPIFIDDSSEQSAEALNETVSDACIGDVFRDCGLTSWCAETFLRKPHARYSLTHQVIFMLVADKNKCNEKSSFRTQYENSFSWDAYKAQLCEQVWLEANVIAEQNFPNELRDLMAEQIAVCSLAGYKNFMQFDWFNEILAWQNTEYTSDSNGCFGVEEVKQKGRIQKRSDFLIQSDVEDEDCSVHFTAVSISALAMYLRYIMEFCYTQ